MPADEIRVLDDIELIQMRVRVAALEELVSDLGNVIQSIVQAIGDHMAPGVQRLLVGAMHDLRCAEMNYQTATEE